MLPQSGNNVKDQINLAFYEKLECIKCALDKANTPIEMRYVYASLTGITTTEISTAEGEYLAGILIKREGGQTGLSTVDIRDVIDSSIHSFTIPSLAQYWEFKVGDMEGKTKLTSSYASISTTGTPKIELVIAYAKL